MIVQACSAGDDWPDHAFVGTIRWVDSATNASTFELRKHVKPFKVERTEESVKRRFKREDEADGGR
jgi:hypothetical protein